LRNGKERQMKPRKLLHAGKVCLRNRRILIDGTPRLVSAGEIHYFRLAPEVWRNRLTRLRDAGLDTVSTYVPWLWHELAKGQYDFVGSSHPGRNLVAFVELCKELGLNVIVKPGPFCMAELKNEGIPSRVRFEHPEVRPITWDGKPVSTMTLDYLAPAFLAEVKAWYDAVMPVLARYTFSNGGPIIAMQLDNEIGMLSWVSNGPDLTDGVCEEIRAWCLANRGFKIAQQRIGADPHDVLAWAKALRSPGENSLALHRDIGLYMRERFASYVTKLREMARGNGVMGIPFIVNVHGTGGGRARTFPIGISQLHETWASDAQTTAGSDLYLGDLTVANVADLYVVNAMLRVMLERGGERKPLTSMEFEAGTGNYGSDLGELYSPEAVRQKTILSTAQGYRLLNFYMLAGGENPTFGTAADGIDRLASTGQLHGYAAPVAPDGKVNATYLAIAQAMASINGVRSLLSTSEEENDGFALGVAIDHYLTEYHHPRSADRSAQIAELERFRGLGPRDILTRALLLGGFSFPCVDLQAGVPECPVVVFPTGRVLGAQVQVDLAQYVRGGGKLLLVGALPDTENNGEPCTILSDALGLKNHGRVVDTVRDTGPYWPTVRAQGWVAPHPDERVTEAQLMKPVDGQEAVVLLTEIASQLPCAVEVNAGKGKAIVLGCDFPADLDFYRLLMRALGVVPRWQVMAADGPGLVVTSTLSQKGERLLYLVNVAPQAVSFHLRHRGRAVFHGRRITVPARGSMLLPHGVRRNDVTIVQSTAEIVQFDDGKVIVNPTQNTDLVVLRTKSNVRCAIGELTRRGKTVEVSVSRHEHKDRPVLITFD
jgi:beta-galactosidase